MKVRRNLLQTALILMIITQLLSAVIRVSGQPVPIGTTVQTNPFESNPTATTTAVTGILNGGFTGATTTPGDGDFATNINWRIGGSNTAGGRVNVTVSTFAGGAFTIGWVDLKLHYRASATTDDRYRIYYHVLPEGAETWHILQDWVSGTSARFNYNGEPWSRAWSNVAEPNDGVWDWADVANIEVRVETQRVSGEDAITNRFYLHEVWLSIYEGSYPAAGPGVSIQPAVVAGLVTGDVFFIDVYVPDVVQMHSFQFLITYNTTVLTAFEYFTYTPFILAAPSEINDDPWGNGTGYVAIAYSSYLGDPTGFTGSEPVVRIYFIVDLEGTSLLHFDMVNPDLNRRVLLSDTFGLYIPPLYINDGVFATNPIHDVSVTDISVNATQVLPTGQVEVNVTVANQGTFVETFTLTAFYDSTVIAAPQVVTSLGLAESRIITFDWDTTGVSLGHYVIKAETSVIPGETDTADNTFTDGTVIVGRHDVAVTALLRAFPTIDVAIPASVANLNVTQGELVYINVTVANLGTFTGTFNLTVFYDAQEERTAQNPTGSKTLGTQTDVTLAAGANLNFSYTFDTRGVKYDPPHGTPQGGIAYDNLTFCEIKARVTTVPFEIGSDYDNSGNNLRIDGTANVSRAAPSAGFSVNPDNVYIGQPVEFDARISQPDPKNATTIVKYDWHFGDGNFTSVSTAVVKHAYASAGSYQANLTVWNSAGFNASFTPPSGKNIIVYVRDIAISNVVPSKTTAVINEVVNITVTLRNWSPRDEQGGVNVTVFYNDIPMNYVNVTVYYGSALVVDPITGRMHFNASTTTYAVGAVTSATNTTTIIFMWNTSRVTRGSYVIRAVARPLPVTGTETYETYTANNTFTYSDTVSLFNAPTVSFSFAPAKPFVTQPVAFDASGSSDLDGTIASYKWDFGDGNTTSVTSSTVRHAYAAKGKYTVNLTVTDNEGFARSMVQNVTVYIRDLSVFSVEASPTSVTAGDMVTISVTVRNEGESADSFEVVVMASRDGGSDEDIDFANVTNLAPGGFNTVTFNWDTSGWGAGAYTIKGSVDSNYDSDTSDNLGVGGVVNVAAPTNWLLYGAVAAVVGVAVALGLLYFFKFRKK